MAISLWTVQVTIWPLLLYTLSFRLFQGEVCFCKKQHMIFTTLHRFNKMMIFSVYSCRKALYTGIIFLYQMISIISEKNVISHLACLISDSAIKSNGRKQIFTPWIPSLMYQHWLYCAVLILWGVFILMDKMGHKHVMATVQ